jgi:hypothetical protein
LPVFPLFVSRAKERDEEAARRLHNRNPRQKKKKKKKKKDSMLSTLLSEHQPKRAALAATAAGHRRAAQASSAAFAVAALRRLNEPVAASYAAESALAAEVREVSLQAERFARLSARWAQGVRGLNVALKELGDVDNWAAAIERDMAAVAGFLEAEQRAGAGGALE